MRGHVVAAVLAAALLGCAPMEKPLSLSDIRHDEPSAEYTKTWDAARKVMSNYFMIRMEDKDRGSIVAEPDVGAYPLAKYRTRVAAQLMPAGDGLWDVQVRVMNELEVSEPNTWGVQPGDEWVTVAFDKTLEAKLVNEINHGRFGRPAWKIPNPFMKPAGSAPPVKHRDLLEALPKSTGAALDSSNPLTLDKDGTHLALIEQRPTFGDRYTQMIARGDIAFRHADFGAAVVEYGSAVEEQPNDPAAHAALSHVYLALGRYRDAAHALRKALALGTAWLDIRIDLAKLYADPKMLDEQLAELRKHLDDHPDDLSARVILGYSLLCRGDRKGAESELNAALHKDPRDDAARKLLDRLGPAA